MDKVVYVCTGTCHAEVSDKEYEEGLTKCGTKDCTHFGHSFEKVLKCHECGAYFKPGDNHSHLA